MFDCPALARPHTPRATVKMRVPNAADEAREIFWVVERREIFWLTRAKPDVPIRQFMDGRSGVVCTARARCRDGDIAPAGRVGLQQCVPGQLRAVARDHLCAHRIAPGALLADREGDSGARLGTYTPQCP